MKSYSYLSFGIVIAHLFPGGIFLLSIFLLIDRSFNYFLLGCIIREKRLFLENGPILFIIFLLTSLIFGLIIDGIRSILPEKLFLRKKTKDRPDKLFSTTREEFEIMKFLLENYFRYHQFYGNISLSLVIFSFSVLFYSPCFTSWTFNKRLTFFLITFVLSWLLYFASGKALYNFYEHTKKVLTTF